MLYKENFLLNQVIYYITCDVGLEHIFYLTITNQQLSIYLESHEGEVAYANYSTFYIDGNSNNYSLTVSIVIYTNLVDLYYKKLEIKAKIG